MSRPYDWAEQESENHQAAEAAAPLEVGAFYRFYGHPAFSVHGDQPDVEMVEVTDQAVLVRRVDNRRPAFAVMHREHFAAQWRRTYHPRYGYLDQLTPPEGASQ